MKREAGECLSAVFVDYDNIYLSLKRKNDEAARRFAKDAGAWLRAIESGRLITPTNAPLPELRRRLVMNRCYGNPVPRRNTHDNSTDMSSFPFVRHHFLRAGFEVVDCPPLTAQLKNSSDIRMVMDVRDYLTHDTHFDEFIILSGDADFTPVLHRLRAHARRTVIFANDFTAAPYTAISDAEVRESDLIALIMGTEPGAGRTPAVRLEDARREILAEVVASVRASEAPVALEALADRTVRALGHEKTIATGWAGAGSFSELLRRGLPEGVRLSSEPPYTAFDAKRHRDPRASQAELRAATPAAPALAPRAPAPAASLPTPGLFGPPPAITAQPSAALTQAPAPGAALARPSAPPADLPGAGEIQQSITRIQEACQAPPLAPHEYRLLFEIMAKEISTHDLIGAQTLTNIVQNAQEKGLELRRDDVRFVLEVVSEADPWFEQGASANLFAGRFRNFVVARCRGQGLNLSADELDLIDAWFAGGSAAPPPPGHASPAPAAKQGANAPPPVPASGQRWWSFDDRKSGKEGPAVATAQSGDEFPRIVTRGRMRG
jgi:hypothetical protein